MHDKVAHINKLGDIIHDGRYNNQYIQMFKYALFSEYSLVNLLNNQLYMNHYENFNDPFECRSEIFTGFPNKESNSSRVSEIIQAWGFEDYNDITALECYEDLIIALEDTEPNVENSIDKARICCFSKNSNNLLMWAHYANGLRGFCLEFDSDKILLDDEVNGEVFEVLYSDKPSVIDTAVIAVLNNQVEYNEDAIYETKKRLKYLTLNNEEKESAEAEIHMYKTYLDDVYFKNREIYQKMLATKSIEWQYEEELRIILQTENLDKHGVFFKYPIQSLKSIIIGEKMPISQRETILNIVRSKSLHIKLKIATRIPGQFGVTINDWISK